jgi:RimJ/RimL family protein N-acetyltransferase
MTTPTPPTLMNVTPVTLDGTRVRMEPFLMEKHWEGLVAIGLDEDLWRWTVAQIRNAADLRRYLETAVRERSEGRSLPFTTIDKASGRVAGCTRFGNIDRDHRKLEIGWTWVGAPYQRSYVNTEAKYLMLRHAFETLGCLRVEFKTSVLNARSRNAMLRIGCIEEGTLRKHMVNENGTRRDSVYFSILDDEWPGVKARLEEMMKR